MMYRVRNLCVAAALFCFYTFAGAATLQPGDVLTITPGTSSCDAGTSKANGSCFMMGGPTGVANPISGFKGIKIGTTQPASGSHSGAPGCTNGVGSCNNTGENPNIDNPWLFFGNTGMHQTTVAITQATTTATGGTLNFSGWNVTWNGIPSINMGSGGVAQGGAQAVNGPNNNGSASFEWDGNYGSTYQLWYNATVPTGDPSGFGGVDYTLHLVGTVQAAGAVSVVPTSPANGAVGVPVTATIALNFSEAMNSTTINNTSIVIMPSSGGAAVNCTWATTDNITFTCTPNTALSSATQYNVTVNSGAKTASSGQAVTGAPKTFSFTTAAPPTVASVSPANSATGVSLGAAITVTFVSAVDPATITANTFKITPTAGGVAVSCTYTNSGNTTFICTPTAPLAGNTDYTVQLTTGIKNAAGIAMSAPFVSTFKTATGLARKLGVGDVLTICSGSTFGMEQTPGTITVTSLVMANGIKIGIAQPASGSHSGAPNGSETPGVDKPWTFFNNTGMHFTSTPITSIDGTTLDFSGWRVTWNAIPSINMGGAPASFAQDTGKASISWDGVDGGAYTLDYAAHVPLGDPSGFGGVPYTLHLVGRVNTATVQSPCEVKPITSEGVEVTVNKGTVVPSSLTSILPNAADLAAAGLSEAGRPTNLDFYLYRLMRYTVTGLASDGSDEVTITLIFPSDIPAGSKLYKVSASGFTLIADAVFSGRNATFKIKDNGPFDENKANGIITDPVALGTPLPALQSSGGSGGGCTLAKTSGQGEVMFGVLLLLAGLSRYSKKKLAKKTCHE